MRKPVLAVLAAAIASPAFASPALAQSGRIACEKELAPLVRWSAANPQAAAGTLPADWIEVLAAQCRYSPRLAEASMDGLRQRLGMPGTAPQVAYDPSSPEWSGVAGLAD